MATQRTILVIQPAGADRDMLADILRRQGHVLHLADTMEDALAAVHAITSTSRRYDAIFLSGFPTAGMCALVNKIREIGCHAATDIIGCSESIESWLTVHKDSYFSFTRTSDGGWNHHTLLHSFLPILRLA